ncbi:MAG TPA: hypothetical protein VKY26_08450 [Actinomycetota bacterium]|nr:hypothetical protein [Actinomycetota bacterium]
MRPALLTVVVLVALAAGIGACTRTLDGTVSGKLTFSGGPSPGCSLCPVGDATVRAHLGTAGGHVISTTQTGSDGRFLIRLKPGLYVLTSNDGMGCSATAVVLPRKTSAAELDCGAP